MSDLSERDLNDLRHLALIARANQHDGVAVEITQDRIIQTFRRMLAAHDPASDAGTGPVAPAGGEVAPGAAGGLGGASCGARVCSADYTHGPHEHHDGVLTLTPPSSSDADRDTGLTVSREEFARISAELDGPAKVIPPLVNLAAKVADRRDTGLSDALVEAMIEHDDPPGWTCDDSDMLVYECNCGDRSPALDHDHIGPEDVEAAAAWHRLHVANAVSQIVAERERRAAREALLAAAEEAEFWFNAGADEGVTAAEAARWLRDRANRQEAER